MFSHHTHLFPNFTICFQLLNFHLSMFDGIMDNHNIQKIEQNNDVYCVASGVPVVTNKHTMNVCDFLLEVMNKITTFNISSLPDVTVKIRAGAHTGLKFNCNCNLYRTLIPSFFQFGRIHCPLPTCK